MEAQILAILTDIRDFIWGLPLLVLLVGVGGLAVLSLLIYGVVGLSELPLLRTFHHFVFYSQKEEPTDWGCFGSLLFFLFCDVYASLAVLGLTVLQDWLQGKDLNKGEFSISNFLCSLMVLHLLWIFHWHYLTFTGSSFLIARLISYYGFPILLIDFSHSFSLFFHD